MIRLPLPHGARPELAISGAAPAARPPARASVVIPAHDEEAVLGRCLTTLLADAAPDEFDVVVVANGCTDGTAAVARAAGVRVVEIDRASKQAALNGGDAVAYGFPRLYLDADVYLSTAGVRALAAALTVPGRLAATPVRRIDLTGCSLPVRAYYAVNTRLPAYRNGLFGRGVVALSEAGRRRFTRFPDGMVADDLFLDGLFTDTEKTETPRASVRVLAPRRTRDLVRRLAAVRAGNTALRRHTPRARRSRPLSWLHVVLRTPWLAPAAVGYVGVIVAAELRLRADRRRGRSGWSRDESTRVVEPA